MPRLAAAKTLPAKASASAVDSHANDRVTCLDGLRGVAALGVVGFHFLYAFHPGPFMDKARAGFGIVDTPIAALWNGRFSVAVFFVLSGFVLAASAPRSKREAPLMIGLRYLRLGVPALVSSVIAWAWLTGFPDAGRQVQAITHSSWFFWTYQSPIPPLSRAIWEGAVGVFLDGTTKFNNPLWTMRTELLGSIMIYGAYALLKSDLRIPALLAGIMALSGFGQFGLAAFCFGAMIFEFRHQITLHPGVGWSLGALGLILGGPFPGHAAGPGPGDAVLSVLGADGLREAGATLLVMSILATPQLRALFEHRALQRLGELSFPLYLVHVHLICAPAAWLYVHYSLTSPTALAALFLGVVGASFALAAGFLVAVERPVLAGLKALRTRGRARLAAL